MLEADYHAMRTPPETLDVSWSGLRVNTPLVPATVRGRPTAQMAVRVYPTEVKSPDFTGLWGPFLPAFTLDLGAGEGPRYVWVGFRGMDNSGQPGPEVWRQYKLVLDPTPPVLTITEPVNPNTSQPVLQVRGRANEALEGLSFELVNAQGTLTTEPGILLGPIYDEQAFMQEPPEGAPGEPPAATGIRHLASGFQDKRQWPPPPACGLDFARRLVKPPGHARCDHSIP